MRVLSKSFLLSSTTAVALMSCGGSDQKNLTASETVISVKNAVENANLSEAWAALPESYQKDVTEVTRSFAQKVDKDVYNKVTDILGKVNKVFTEKKDIYSEVIYEMSKDQKGGPKSQADVTKGLESLMTILSTVLNSELGNLEKLQKINVAEFISGPASDLVKKVQGISKGSQDQNVLKVKKFFESVKVDLVSEENDQSKLKFSYLDPSTNEMETNIVDFSMIENKWLPTDMVESWAKNMAQTKLDIEAMDGEEFKKKGKMQVMMMLSFADSMVQQFVNAETKEDVMKLLKNSPLGRQLMAPPVATQLPAEVKVEERDSLLKKVELPKL